MSGAATDTVSPTATLSAVNARPGWLDAALLGVILIGMLWGIGEYGLYEPHEGHFAGVAREMVTRGDWITPHLNGAQYLNKPPLFYWIIAASFSIFGISEGHAREPLALIGWLGVLLAWQWARLLWGIRAGRIAAVMLAVSAGWYIFAHQLLIDLLLCVLYFFSVYALWRAIVFRTSKSRWALFYISVGLAIMAKGLIGLAFPVAVAVLYMAIRKDWALIRHCQLISGVLLILLVTLPWLVLVEHSIPGSVKYMIVNEHFNRLVDKRWPPDYSVAKVGGIGFLITTAVWIAPWSLFIVQIARFTWKKQFRVDVLAGGLCGRAESTSIAEANNRSDAVLLVMLAAAVPVLTFLPMPSRLLYYGLPTVPFFVILSTGWWSHTENDDWGVNFGAVLFALIGLIVGIGGCLLPEKLRSVSELMAAPKVIELIPVISVSIGIAMVLGGLLLFYRKPGWSIAMIAVSLAAGGAYTARGFAEYDDVMSSKRLVESLRPRVGDDCIWISEGSKEIGASAGIAFYLGEDHGQARTVKILKADDTNGYRAPPRFPGPALCYLLSHEEMDALWMQDKPVLFVTDFQRKDWAVDIPTLPSKDVNLIKTNHGGNRRVYANSAALKKIGD